MDSALLRESLPVGVKTGSKEDTGGRVGGKDRVSVQGGEDTIPGWRGPAPPAAAPAAAWSTFSPGGEGCCSIGSILVSVTGTNSEYIKSFMFRASLCTYTYTL